MLRRISKNSGKSVSTILLVSLMVWNPCLIVSYGQYGPSMDVYKLRWANQLLLTAENEPLQAQGEFGSLDEPSPIWSTQWRFTICLNSNEVGLSYSYRWCRREFSKFQNLFFPKIEKIIKKWKIPKSPKNVFICWRWIDFCQLEMHSGALGRRKHFCPKCPVSVTHVREMVLCGPE